MSSIGGRKDAEDYLRLYQRWWGDARELEKDEETQLDAILAYQRLLTLVQSQMYHLSYSETEDQTSFFCIRWMVGELVKKIDELSTKVAGMIDASVSAIFAKQSNGKVPFPLQLNADGLEKGVDAAVEKLKKGADYSTAPSEKEIFSWESKLADSTAQPISTRSRSGSVASDRQTTGPPSAPYRQQRNSHHSILESNQSYHQASNSSVHLNGRRNYNRNEANEPDRVMQTNAEEETEKPMSFMTARQQLRKTNKDLLPEKSSSSNGTRQPPRTSAVGRKRYHPANSLTEKSRKTDNGEEEEKHPIFEDERMNSIEERMAELILNEILDTTRKTNWKDIAGLDFAKKSVSEIVIYPMMRPDIFNGIRAPAKGLLLFGPPGTGKTMIGKAIAGEAGATFFNISASSLTSKYVGEGEKMVRALFTVARCFPSEIKVIFIDEIDSLLTQRSESDVEASRRIKTEFLVQMDGAGNDPDERILVIGATNRPQEIDEAARRRFTKRLYIPLPSHEARKIMVRNLLEDQKHNLTDEDLDRIADATDGYSGSDVHALCSEAALGPIRELENTADIRNISAESVGPIQYSHFISALNGIRASVSQNDLKMYEEWNDKFGFVNMNRMTN